MLTSKEVFNRIDEIVERFYTGFEHYLLGKDFLTEEQLIQVESLGVLPDQKPLIELIYILVRQRPTEGYKKDKTLQQLIEDLINSGIFPILPEEHLYSIEHAKAQLHEVLNSTKDELKKKFKQEILKANNNFKNDILVSRIAEPQKVEQKRKDYSKELFSGIALATIASINVFNKGLASSLTDLVNNATTDKISFESVLEGKPKSEMLVYKQVVADRKLCIFCKHFYLNEDGTPKVYKLSELQANGTNDGLPKSAWKPVVGKTHPFCRCQMLEYKDKLPK